MFSDELFSRLMDDCHMMMTGIELLEVSNESNEELRKSMKEVLRKLIISNMLSGRRIISITGEQGAGKSTLIRNLYQLEEGLLPISEGRGEKLPVIISEHESNEYYFIVGRLGQEMNKGLVVEDLVDKETFQRLSQGEDSNVLYLELRVPYKYFQKSKSAFLLLPGYEKANYKDSEYWRDLIDFSVACSDSCIFVYSSSMLSGAGCLEVAQRIKKILNESAKPIFAVSFSESLNEITKKEMIENSLEAFNIPNNEDDRIVFTSNSGSEINEAWINNLMAICSKYVLSVSTSDKLQKDYVMKIISKDLRLLLFKFNQYRERNQSNVRSNVESEAIIKAYDKECLASRKIINKKIKETLDSEKNASIKVIDDLYIGKGEVDFFDKIANFFKTDTTKTILEQEELLRSVMKRPYGNGDVSRVAVAFRNALNNISEDSCNQFSKKIELLLPLETASWDLSTTLVNSNNYSEERKNKLLQIISDINQIMDPDIIKKDEIELLNATNVHELVKAIQHLATYAYADQISNSIVYSIEELSDSTRTYEKNLPSMNQLSDFSRNTVTGILGVVGFDFVPDQELNFVNQLAASLSIPPGIVIGVLGSASIAYFAYTLDKEINRREISSMMYLRRSVQNLYQEAQEKCMNEYDAYIDNIREKLVLFIEKVYRIGRQDMKVLNLRILEARLKRDFEDAFEQVAAYDESI